MNSIKKRILWQLATFEREHSGRDPRFDHTLVGTARQLEEYHHRRRTDEAAGWFPCPIVASAASRSRAVAALLAEGLVEIKGERRGRRVRLTDTGREVVKGMQHGTE